MRTDPRISSTKSTPAATRFAEKFAPRVIAHPSNASVAAVPIPKRDDDEPEDSPDAGDPNDDKLPEDASVRQVHGAENILSPDEVS